VGLTAGSLPRDNTLRIPTITDNLFAQNDIQDNLVAVSFQPTSEANTVNGELSFGGLDSDKFTGPVTYQYVLSICPGIHALSI